MSGNQFFFLSLVLPDILKDAIFCPNEKLRKFLSVNSGSKKNNNHFPTEKSTQWRLYSAHSAPPPPAFLWEEILAHGRHMVQFTLGGGRRSPGPAFINTFLFNSLITVRYSKLPPGASSNMTQVCLQLITQRERGFSQKEKNNNNKTDTSAAPPARFFDTRLEPQWGRSSSGPLFLRRSGSGGDLSITKHNRRWTSGGQKMRPRSCTCTAEGLKAALKTPAEGHSFCKIFNNYIRLAGRTRWAVCCLAALRDERDSHSLRNVSPLAGRSCGFVNYWRFASVIWWAPRDEGGFKSFLLVSLDFFAVK